MNPPFPDHDCQSCEDGEELRTAAVEGLLMGFHIPRGNVCLRYVPPTVYEEFQEQQKRG